MATNGGGRVDPLAALWVHRSSATYPVDLRGGCVSSPISLELRRRDNLWYVGTCNRWERGLRPQRSSGSPVTRCTYGARFTQTDTAATKAEPTLTNHKTGLARRSAPHFRHTVAHSGRWRLQAGQTDMQERLVLGNKRRDPADADQ